MMKKLIYSLIAAGAVAAPIAVAPQAQAKDLGGVDVQQWCDSAFEVGVHAMPDNPSDAYSWVCMEIMVNGDGLYDPDNFVPNQVVYAVDMQDACRRQHKNWTAVAKALDDRDAYSWRCYDAQPDPRSGELRDYTGELRDRQLDNIVPELRDGPPLRRGESGR